MTPKIPAQTVTFTIPLTITVTIGEPLAPTAPVGASAADTPAGREWPDENLQILEAHTPNPSTNFAGRRGFDANFLGFSAPLPKLTTRTRPQALKVTDQPGTGSDGFELKYHNYSLIMNKSRRIAFVSAVNFWADAPKRVSGDRNDKWFADPRAGNFQSRESNYANRAIDRGHLTRRADAGWGTTQAAAIAANDDTFFFTNCSQQHEVFNQSSKSGVLDLSLWGTLENHVVKQARRNGGKLSIFNGPVLTADDPEIDGLKVPLQFWKVIALKKNDGTPSVVAFVISQEDQIGELEAVAGFDPGVFAPDQVSIDEIERLSGLNFGALRNHDPLESAEGIAAVESAGAAETGRLPIRSLSDVII